MGFKERSSWVMAVIFVVLGVYYGDAVYSIALTQGSFPAPETKLASTAILVSIVGSIAANIVAAVMSPEDANAPEDERDKLIFSRAGNIAGWVLGCGVFGGLGHYLFHGDGDALFHILVGSLILSQLGLYVLQVYYYRSGI